MTRRVREMAVRAVLGAAMVCALAGAVAAQDANPVTTKPVAGPTAADSVLDARTSAVASKLRCPVCQGLSIQASPSELAQQMRSVVKDQLAAGKSPEQVQAYFVSKYGEWILLSPEPRGLNLLVYGLPVMLVLGGLLAVALAVRRWTSASPETIS